MLIAVLNSSSDLMRTMFEGPKSQMLYIKLQYSRYFTISLDKRLTNSHFAEAYNHNIIDNKMKIKKQFYCQEPITIGSI